MRRSPALGVALLAAQRSPLEKMTSYPLLLPPRRKETAVLPAGLSSAPKAYCSCGGDAGRVPVAVARGCPVCPPAVGCVSASGADEINNRDLKFVG